MERSIPRLAAMAKERVEEGRFVPAVRERYLRWIGEFEEYAAGRGILELTPELVGDWSVVAEAEACSRDVYLWRMRGARLMCDIAGISAPVFDGYGHKTPNGCEAPERFAGIHAAYLERLRAETDSRITIKVRGGDARRLLFFLDDRVTDLSYLAIDDLDAFMAKRAGEVGKASLESCRASVRRFLGFLLERMEFDDQRLPSFLKDRHKSPPREIKRFLTEGEARSMLAAAESMDSLSSHPRRTRLIVTMLFQYMMRMIDLAAVELDDIDWRSNTIVIRSVKSQSQRVFPLTENMRYIILDYLRHERPRVQHRRLLTAVRFPYAPLTTSNGIYCVLRRVAREAGVDFEGCGFGGHAIRRTGATTLMAEEFDYPVISAVLQHEPGDLSLSDSTLTYIGYDIEQLRSVALEVRPRGRA